MNPPFFWLSFVDPTRAPGNCFLGCIITQGREDGELMPVLQRLHQQGINPGGEARGTMLPPDVPIPTAFLDRLLTREEADALDDLLRGSVVH